MVGRIVTYQNGERRKEKDIQDQSGVCGNTVDQTTEVTTGIVA